MLSSGINVITEGINLERLLDGLLITARIAFISIVIGSLTGIVFGLIRTSKSRAIPFISRVYLEAFRIIPILVWLFIVYFGVTSMLDIHLDGELVAVIVFSLWGAAEMGDIANHLQASRPCILIEES